MVERIQVNLIPIEYRVRSKQLAVSRAVFYPALGAIIIAILMFIVTTSVDRQITDLHSQIAATDAQILQNKSIQEEITQIKQADLQIQQKIGALERISIDRGKWVRLLETIATKVPGYSWLISIDEMSKDSNTIKIEGKTFSFPDVASYMSDISGSPAVQSVDLLTIEQIDNADKNSETVYAFKLICHLPRGRAAIDTSIHAQKAATP